MRTNHVVKIALGAALLLVGPATTGAGDNPPATWSPRDAAKYLDGRADWWLGWSGSARGQGTSCLSCHTTVPFALARPALGQRLGEAEVGPAEKKLLDSVKKRVANWNKIAGGDATAKDAFAPFYARNREPSALGTEAVVNALVLVNHDVRRTKGKLDVSTRKALDHLWGQQQASGAWLWLDFGLNPWESNGAYYGAALAAVAVGMAGKDYFEQAAIEPKVAALTRYLQTQAAQQPLHHRVVSLWASSWLPGVLSKQETHKLVEEVLALQEADSGWALAKLGQTDAGKNKWQSQAVYPTGQTSDGYATGLVVLALKRSGLSADHAKLKNGVAWLAGPEKDGTWPIHYLNRARDPQSDVGKFMRDAATAFAVLALTE